MKIYSVNNLPSIILLGRESETGVEEVRIDCAPWLAVWPDLSISVWVTPPNGSAAYPAEVHMEGDLLVWPVTSADTAIAGNGYVEVMGKAEGKKKLSAYVSTQILATTTGATSDPPEGAKPWVDAVLNARDESAKAAEESANAAEVASESAEAAEEAAQAAEGHAKAAEESANRVESIINIGAEHAGKLLYVDADGKAAPLAIGSGLAIVDGKLVVTNSQVAAAICGQVVCGAIICGEG